MNLLGEVLRRIISKNRDLGQGVHEARILGLWAQAMGDSIARHSRATHLKGSTLYVSVDHPVWRQELHSNKLLALQKLNKVLFEALGKPEQREFWIEEIFFSGSGVTANANSSRGSRKPPKK